MTTNTKQKSQLSLGKRIAAGAITAALGLSMAWPYGATAALAEEASKDTTTKDEGTQQAGQSQTAKNEVVYTKTDASGQSTGVYVVNSFDTAQQESVDDPGTYTTVENLSTSQALTDEGGSVNIETQAGIPTYYQGNLDSSTQLPWKVQLTYRLDGKEVSPEELAGKTGDLDIELKVDALDDGSAKADFAQSFLLQAQGTFDNDTFKLDDAGDATIATVGNNTLVTYLLIPGESGDWHIKGDAKDFTYSGWQITGMPLNLAIDLSQMDTSQLTDASNQLTDGATQLADGGTQLREALGLISTGAGTAADGSVALTTGSSQLAQGTSSLKTGAQGLREALDAQSGNFNKLATGSRQVANGNAQLYQALSTQLPQKLTELSTGIQQAKNTLATIDSQLQGIEKTTGQAQALAGQITAQKDKVEGELNAMAGSVDSLKTALGSVGTDVSTAGTSALAAAGDAKAGAEGVGTAAGEAKTAAEKDKAALATLGGIDTTGMTEAQKKAIETAKGQVKASMDADGQAATDAGAAAQSSKKGAEEAGAAAQSAKSAGDTLTAVSQQFEASNIQAQSDQLKADVATLNGYLDALDKGAQDSVGASQTILQESKGVAESSQQMLSGAQEAMGQLDPAQLKQLSDGAAQVADGVEALTSQLEATQGTDTIGGGVNALAAGATQVDAGAQKLNAGAGQLSDGMGTLADGSSQAYAGSQELESGLDTLVDSVSGMDQKLLDGIQEAVDQKLGSGYTLHSFVDASNTNVKEVEFVYVVSGIKESDDSQKQASDQSEDDSSNQSFVDRLAALFDKKDE